MCGDRKSEDVFMSEETDTFNAETLCVCAFVYEGREKERKEVINVVTLTDLERDLSMISRWCLALIIRRAKRRK